MQQHVEVPSYPKAEEAVEIVAVSASIEVRLDNTWKARYSEWRHSVFAGSASHIPIARQKCVLDTIHYRVVMEEYETLQEDYSDIWKDKPKDIQVDVPLLRCVHGLPRSGKSQLLPWIKQYFEQVWQWEANNQFAIVAPQNAMADNIGGGTIHSFANIPFKDPRGNIVNTRMKNNRCCPTNGTTFECFSLRKSKPQASTYLANRYENVRPYANVRRSDARIAMCAAPSTTQSTSVWRCQHYIVWGFLAIGSDRFQSSYVQSSRH